MKFSQAIIGLVLFTFKLCDGFEFSLKEKKDALLYWKFSESYPFHYFDNISTIPASFLPIRLEANPERKGLWILRYKDFETVPLVYTADNLDPFTSIRFSSYTQLFNNVKITALIYGDADVDLSTDSSYRGGIHLEDYVKPCGNTTNNETKENHNEESSIDLSWISYEFHTELSSHIQLKSKLHHARSFLIIDEITVSYEEGNSTMVNANSIEIKNSMIYNLHCKNL